MKATALRSVLIASTLVLAALACSAVPSSPGTGGGDSSLLKDDFSDSGSGWGTGSDADSSVEYDSGGLHMKIVKDNFFTWSNPDTATYKNVHLEVTAKNQNGSTRAGFGLMCDQQSGGSSYYYFAITPSGEYVIGKSVTGKDDAFLTNNDSWATSDLIPRDADTYRIGADCGAGTLTLYVDGKKIDSVTDSTYTDGGVGLFLWSGSDPAGEVTYDDFVMTKMK